MRIKIFNAKGLRDIEGYLTMVEKSLKTSEALQQILEREKVDLDFKRSLRQLRTQYNREARRLKNAKAALARLQRGEYERPMSASSLWERSLNNLWDTAEHVIKESDYIQEAVSYALHGQGECFLEEARGQVDSDYAKDLAEEQEFQAALEAEQEEGGNPFAEPDSYYPSDLIPIWSRGYKESCFEQ